MADLEDVGKPESQQLLYRAARELLANIHKHARATTVRAGLSRRGDRVVLTIADDGTGFDPEIVESYVADGHIGLGSLLARFDAMGGSMAIDSAIGRGTQVTVISPPEPVACPRAARSDRQRPPMKWRIAIAADRGRGAGSERLPDSGRRPRRRRSGCLNSRARTSSSGWQRPAVLLHGARRR